MRNPRATELREMVENTKGKNFSVTLHYGTAQFIFRLNFAESMIEDWLKEGIITKFDAKEMFKYEDEIFIERMENFLKPTSVKA